MRTISSEELSGFDDLNMRANRSKFLLLSNLEGSLSNSPLNFSAEDFCIEYY